VRNKAGARRGRLTWIAWLLAALGIPLAAAATVLTVNDQWAPWLTGLPVPGGAQFRANVFLLEAALLVIAAPLGAVALIARSAAVGSKGSGLLARLRAVTSPVVAAATSLTVVSAVLLGRGATGETGTLLISHATLWAAALGLAGIGALAAAMFADALDAAASAVGIAVLAAAAVFVSGPLLDGAPASVVRAALLASPVAGAASAADIDIFRTDPLYRLSPLAHMRFDYPSWSAAAAAYLAVATACLTATALRLDRRARHSSAERIPL
jgi:hypothetical protein